MREGSSAQGEQHSLGRPRRVKLHGARVHEAPELDQEEQQHRADQRVRVAPDDPMVDPAPDDEGGRERRERLEGHEQEPEEQARREGSEQLPEREGALSDEQLLDIGAGFVVERRQTRDLLEQLGRRGDERRPPAAEVSVTAAPTASASGASHGDQTHLALDARFAFSAVARRAFGPSARVGRVRLIRNRELLGGDVGPREELSVERRAAEQLVGRPIG